MPALLVEALEPEQRERTHQHIETCSACGRQWAAYRETWDVLGTLPEVEPPAALKVRFLASIDQTAPAEQPRVIPFYRRHMRWLAEAAAVAIVAGSAFYAGHRAIAPQPQTPAIVNSVSPAFSIAESRVLPASAVSPTIEGRPNIENVSFIDANPNDPEIGLSFDITSHVTVTGRPTDKSMVRLLRYVLENENKLMPSRSRAIDVVRNLYSQPGNADPEIADALANVLRNDSHEGVRIKAVETLNRMPVSASADTRDALIQALKSDPNPAVRIKAVEALANLARSGAQLDAATVDTLRQKAVQNDENVYVRVKAAEALSNIHP
ncbi:MAG TPA: HEAT repeat domain-containing protein [Thermoanaerobaculia bacterium]|nr:HEAT repeat domain-containing protein [Thermoanaerobaculia bacterium]